MRKSDFKGWQEVFRFAFEQGVKQKVYVGFLIFMAIATLVSLPVVTMIQKSSQKKDAKSEVSVLTIYDETGLAIDYSEALPQEKYTDVQIVTKKEMTLEEHTKALEDSEDSREMLVHITYEDAGYFNLTFIKAAHASLDGKDCDSLSADFESFFEEAKIRAIDVSEEQMAFINQSVDTRIQFTQEDGKIIPAKEKEEGISLEEYYLILGLIVFSMMVISVCGSNIATSIVTEKTTRVVEYLMINIRPMALIIGKILANLLLVLIQFAAIGVCYLLSNVVNTALFDGGSSSEKEGLLTSLLSSLTNVSVGNLILSLVVIMAGVLFFSIIAGLAGASVSKMEEMAEGLKLYQMLLVVGAYIGIFLCILQMMGTANEMIINICCLIPVAAPFIVPANLLTGHIHTGVAMISILILLICTGALFVFTARVYESLIFYNGKVMKLKDILQIAKKRGETAEKEAK